MEPFQETFTVRTRDGREFPGFTLSSLKIAIDQHIFTLEDAVHPDRVAGTWTTLSQVLNQSERRLAPTPGINVPGPSLVPLSEPMASTGIALDLSAHQRPQRIPVPESRISVPSPPQPMEFARFVPEDDEGPARHRLRIAGGFLLFWGVLGMVGYSFGKRGPADIIGMLVNTGLGIALLMNLQPIRKWAVGWVVAGWGLMCGVGVLSGCFGFVIIGVLSTLVYGGPACLLWGEDCPTSRFWAGVCLMGTLILLTVLGILLVALAGAAMLQRLAM